MNHDNLSSDHGTQRQPRHDPVQDAEERVGQKTIGDRIGVHHPPSAWRQQFDPAQRIVIDKLQCHQQPGQQGECEVSQRGQEIPAHQPFHHERLRRRDAWRAGVCSVMISPSRPSNRHESTQRLHDEHGPAEDEMSRGSDPPRNVVQNPVPANQQRLQPVDQPVKIDNPQRQGQHVTTAKRTAEGGAIKPARQDNLEWDTKDTFRSANKGATEGQRAGRFPCARPVPPAER